MIRVKPRPETQLQVGMIDPYLNETVTFMADMDMESAHEDVKKFRRSLCSIMILMLPLSICFPCILLCMYCCVYRVQKDAILSAVKRTQVYITESTFVYVTPHLPIERARTTVPLANVATVFSHGNVLTVNIKPTSPEVILNSNHRNSNGAYSTYVTRTIKVKHIANASALADTIRSHIMT